MCSILLYKWCLFVPCSVSLLYLIIFSNPYLFPKRWTNDDRISRTFPLGYVWDMSKNNTPKPRISTDTVKKKYSSGVLRALKHYYTIHVLVISDHYANSFTKSLSKAIKINKSNTQLLRTTLFYTKPLWHNTRKGKNSKPWIYLRQS